MDVIGGGIFGGLRVAVVSSGAPAGRSYERVAFGGYSGGSNTHSLNSSLGDPAANRAFYLIAVGQNSGPVSATLNGSSMKLLLSTSSGWPAGVFYREDTTSSGVVTLAVVYSSAAFEYRGAVLYKTLNFESSAIQNSIIQLSNVTDVIAVNASEYMFGLLRTTSSPASWPSPSGAPDEQGSDSASFDLFAYGAWTITTTNSTFNLNLSPGWGGAVITLK